VDFLWPSSPAPSLWSFAAAGAAPSPTDSTLSLLPPQGDERDANGCQRDNQQDDRPEGPHRRFNERSRVVRRVDEADELVNAYRDYDRRDDDGDKRHDQTAYSPLHGERRE
jgi:hypothetical protein